MKVIGRIYRDQLEKEKRQYKARIADIKYWASFDHILESKQKKGLTEFSLSFVHKGNLDNETKIEFFYWRWRIKSKFINLLF